jgi:hypothetical protein
MDGLLKTIENIENEDDFSFKKLLVPLTNTKAITWIVVIGFVVFFNSLFNGFVWDDLNIVYNPQIFTSNLFNILGNNVVNTGTFYRPFFMLYIITLHNIFSTNVFFYHFLQISVHIVNACLLFYFFTKFINKNLAYSLSLIFLIHPIQTESVVWISATLVPLSFVFGIEAVILSLGKKLNFQKYLLLFLLLLLSVFTRETGFIFFILIFYLQIFYKKTDIKKILVVETFVALVYLYCRFILAKVFFDYNFFSPFKGLSFVEKLTNTPAVIFYYIKTVIFPYSLSIDQLWTVKSINFFNFYLPLLVIIFLFCCILMLAIRLKNKRKENVNIYNFFLIWFVLGFLTLLPFMPLDLTVADRYFYFPFAGLLGLVGVVVNEVHIKNPVTKKILISVVALVIVSLSIRTLIRNEDWKTNFTLVNHDIHVEDNFDMEDMYGTLLAVDNNNYRLALQHFLKSVKLFPYESNLKNVGSTYLNLGQKKEALKYFYIALQAKNFSNTNTHNQITYEALSTLLFQMNDYHETARISALGIKDHPDDLQLYILLSLSEYKLNDQYRALDVALRAYQLFPNAQTRYLYTQIKNGQTVMFNISK